MFKSTLSKTLESTDFPATMFAAVFAAVVADIPLFLNAETSSETVGRTSFGLERVKLGLMIGAFTDLLNGRLRVLFVRKVTLLKSRPTVPATLNGRDFAPDVYDFAKLMRESYGTLKSNVFDFVDFAERDTPSFAVMLVKAFPLQVMSAATFDTETATAYGFVIE